MTSQQVADALGIGRSRLFFLARRYGLHARPQDTATCRRTDDPSPEEIAERAAFVRSSWSEEELERRACGAKRIRVEIRGFSLNPTDYSFTSMPVS